MIDMMFSLEFGAKNHAVFLCIPNTQRMPGTGKMFDMFENLVIQSNLNLHFWYAFWKAILYSYKKNKPQLDWPGSRA